MERIRVRRWDDVKEKARNRGLTNPADVERARREQLDEVRTFKLAEIRKSQHVTQQQLAKALHVAQPSISQLENGDLDNSAIGTLRGYVEALGGHLHIVADFGDETLAVQ
jgi:DNA-binding XRE family transcriptional regulator